MSHGVHRGILKGGKKDFREHFLKDLKNKINNIEYDFFGYKRKNLYGQMIF